MKLLNYKKDRSVFWNLLCIVPVHDQQGNLHRFLGCQVDVTADRPRPPGVFKRPSRSP